MRKTRENDVKRMVQAVVLGFAGTLSLPVIVRSTDLLVLGNSILSFFLFIILSVILYKALDVKIKHKRDLILSGIFSTCFSIAMAFGKELEFVEYVDFTDGVMWIAIAVNIVIFSVLMRYIWHWMESYRRKIKCEKLVTAQRKTIMKWVNELSGWKRLAGMTLIFIICFLPLFIASYPGFFVYDATDEVRQYINWEFTDRHPLLHVLLLGKIVQTGYELTGSYNFGIAAFMVIQMLCCAVCFAWVMEILRKIGTGKWLKLITFLFFAFFPVIKMYVICSSKDTLYTICMVGVIGLLIEMVADTASFLENNKKLICLAVMLYGMAIFRNNGLYIFWLMIVIFIILAGKGRRFKMGVLMAGTLVGILFTNYALRTVLKPVSTGAMETLTVPIQQLARAYNLKSEVFEQEEKKILYEILPEEALLRYRARLSDPVKSSFKGNKFEENPGKYIYLWLRIGLKCPFTYINAWMETSYGFWYPDAVINVYKGNGVQTFTYEDSSYFGFETEEPGKRSGHFPWLLEQYRKISLELFQQKMPVISMLFSPGFMFWLFTFACVTFMKDQEWKKVAVFAPALLNWLTVMFGPTYLVRYVLIFWFSLPLLVALFLNGSSRNYSLNKNIE